MMIVKAAVDIHILNREILSLRANLTNNSQRICVLIVRTWNNCPILELQQQIQMMPAHVKTMTCNVYKKHKKITMLVLTLTKATNSELTFQRIIQLATTICIDYIRASLEHLRN